MDNLATTCPCLKARRCVHLQMNLIELQLDSNMRGAFVINDGSNRLAEMNVAISDGNVIVFHTKVSDHLRGQGVGARLVETMVEYAKKNTLKVVPLCSYVRAQFEKDTNKYADLWNQHWHH